jgi:hypothetical protein
MAGRATATVLGASVGWLPGQAAIGRAVAPAVVTIGALLGGDLAGARPRDHGPR